MKKISAASSLLSAMTSLSLAATTPVVCAEIVPAEVQFGFFHYHDWQGKDRRIRIISPMARIRSSISDTTSLEGSFIYDGISGASALYHDTLSGASGKGIKDSRTAEDLAVTQNLGSVSMILGFNHSLEDDYQALGSSLELQIPSADNNTTISLGGSLSHDTVTSTNDPLLDERKKIQSAGITLTQIINQYSIIQSTVTFSGSSGYHDDPYKSLDHRPTSRNQASWLTRYVYYHEHLDASTHLDYRLYRDTWGIIAHTMEISWYKPLMTSWMLAPHIRFYSQEKAEFYNNTFPPNEEDSGFYTADTRLSGFGGITVGTGISYAISENTSCNANFDLLQQRGAWKIGSPGSPGIDPLYGFAFGIGLTIKL